MGGDSDHGTEVGPSTTEAKDAGPAVVADEEEVVRRGGRTRSRSSRRRQSTRGTLDAENKKQEFNTSNTYHRKLKIGS